MQELLRITFQHLNRMAGFLVFLFFSFSLSAVVLFLSLPAVVSRATQSSLLNFVFWTSNHKTVSCPAAAFELDLTVIVPSHC